MRCGYEMWLLASHSPKPCKKTKKTKESKA